MAVTAQAQSVGKLERFPLADLLVFLLEQRATGTLVFQERNQRKSAFYFYMGAAVKAQTPALLLQQSSPDEALFQHLEWAAALGGSTVFGFYSGLDYLHRLQPEPANPLAQLWRCVKRSVDSARVNTVLSKLGDRRIGLHDRADLSRFAFGWEDVAALESLRSGEHRFSDLLAQFEGDPAALCKLVYLLVISRHIALGGNHQPVGVEGATVIVAPRLSPPNSIPSAGGPRRSSSRPFKSSVGPPRAMSGMKRQAKAQRNSLAPRRRAATGPPASARVGSCKAPQSIETIHRRPPSTAQRQPPVRVPSSRCAAPNGDALLRPTRPAASGGARAIEIVELGNPPLLFPHAAEDEPWSRAEALARSGNFDKALRLVEGRYRPSWNNAARGAFVAYLRARLGNISAQETNETLALCTKAMTENPHNVVYRLYRAWVFKSVGRVNASLMDFMEVARRDPDNVDAAREVHLAGNRRTGTPRSSGLVGMLRRSLNPSSESHPEVFVSHRETVRARKK